MAEKKNYTYDWPRPMVTVDAIVFAFFEGTAKVLLINRKNEPFKGFWAIPGGFVDMDEELEGAAARELKEETSLTSVELKQMHTFGTCGRDPRGRQITIVFMGIVEQPTPKIKPGDDAQKAKWFDIKKLPQNLAFDHDEVLKFAIKKLKYRK